MHPIDGASHRRVEEKTLWPASLEIGGSGDLAFDCEKGLATSAVDSATCILGCARMDIYQRSFYLKASCSVPLLRPKSKRKKQKELSIASPLEGLQPPAVSPAFFGLKTRPLMKSTKRVCCRRVGGKWWDGMRPKVLRCCGFLDGKRDFFMVIKDTPIMMIRFFSHDKGGIGCFPLSKKQL